MTKAKISVAGRRVEVTTKHSFSKSGTYFPVLRVASQRNGDMETPFEKIYNLDKDRVVVE